MKFNLCSNNFVFSDAVDTITNFLTVIILKLRHTGHFASSLVYIMIASR